MAPLADGARTKSGEAPSCGDWVFREPRLEALILFFFVFFFKCGRGELDVYPDVERCGRRLWNSTSSTVQTAPLTFSTRMKHLCSDRLWRTAFCRDGPPFCFVLFLHTVAEFGLGSHFRSFTDARFRWLIFTLPTPNFLVWDLGREIIGGGILTLVLITFVLFHHQNRNRGSSRFKVRVGCGRICFPTNEVPCAD